MLVSSAIRFACCLSHARSVPTVRLNSWAMCSMGVEASERTQDRVAGFGGEIGNRDRVGGGVWFHLRFYAMAQKGNGFGTVPHFNARTPAVCVGKKAEKRKQTENEGGEAESREER